MDQAGCIVLYVEDEESDALLMRIAFEKAGLEAKFRTVDNGQAAIDYLSGTGAYQDREKFPLPAVVLLDLNLPEIHGFEVLKWIRAHPLHRDLPVVVFTSSSREEDRIQACELGATEFLEKPNSPSLFKDVVRKLSQQWLTEREIKVR